jgi:PKD repeat protein
VRELLYAVMATVLTAAGLTLVAPAAQAADTGNTATQTGKIVGEEPGKNAPHILDGTVYSMTQVGNTIVVGGQFTRVQNYNTSTVLTRNNVFAFDATTGRVSSTFAPEPNNTVYKVQAAADGKSVYVGGRFNVAAGKSTPSRLVKADVATGSIDTAFAPPTISGDIRDLEVVGNRLWLAGKFTHIGSIVQRALATINASTGKYDSYFTGVMAGVLRTNQPQDVTNVLQISSNPSNTRLTAVGNFATVDGLARSQVATFDISGASKYAVANWSTNQFTSPCNGNFETLVQDVEYSPDGQYFVISTGGGFGGYTSSMNGTSGCDVVARFETNGTGTAVRPTWTAYTGGDTTWTVEVTDDVVYVGGHHRWQNNPTQGGGVPGAGAVVRTGVAALNPANGMPYSWNPTRALGVGVQDLLATSQGLYVGSDTELLGKTPGNTYHARIAFLPLAGGKRLPVRSAYTLPGDVYFVASGASAFQRRAYRGTETTTSTAAPSGPGWSTSVGAFMVNGILYKANNDGLLTKQTFNGTTYGTASPVNASDAIVNQSDWHTDVKTITSLFYAGGFIYYTKSGTNALYRRGFETESDVVGQQRFSTTTTGINWSSVRGAYVANGKIFYALSTGKLYAATWNQAAHAPVAGTIVQRAASGWSARVMFPYQGAPAAVNEPPVGAANLSCDKLRCSFDASGSSDPEGGALTYDWDFGDGTAHGTAAKVTHDYAQAGDRPVTLKVSDNKGATSTVSKTASPTTTTDSVTFVASSNLSGSRANHSVAVPSGTQVGDTLLLFFTANSTGPDYTGPSGWQQVLSENGDSFVGRLYTRRATSSDLGSTVTVTSRNADGTAYTVKDDMTLAAYRGVGSAGVTAAAITPQDVPDPVHQTPTVTADDGNGWLVSFWSDKSSATTSWSGPSTETQRSTGAGTGGSHMSSLLTDSGRRVSSGAQGGLNATADSSGPGLTMSVLLRGNAGQPPPNQPPVALAAPVSCTQLTCDFDGGGSTDPEGESLTYSWSWGDGTPVGSGATPSHTYTSGGSKTVTLTVTDARGATGVDTVTASPVAPPVNAAPTARITNAGCTQLVCSFDGSTSSDPDPDALSYSWNFGDGTAAGTTANPTHTYAGPGTKNVTLTVSDGQGHTATDTVSVEATAPPAENAAPTARITGDQCAGLVCSASGSTSSDPDGDTLSYSWDFGDGTPAESGPSPSHTYATPGTRTVVLTVDDGHGHTHSASTSLAATSPPDEAAGEVAFVGATSTNGNRLTHATAIPTGVAVGDTLVAFFTCNTTDRTFTPPSGWTEIEAREGNGIYARAWTRTATAADRAAGAKVTVLSSGTAAKSDITVAAYRGTDGSSVAASASKVVNTAGATHTSPAVTATGDQSWLVTYWGEKSNDTTSWTAPAGQSQRATSAGSGSGHISALLTDGNGPVPSGPTDGLSAIADSTSSRGASFSVLLKSP